MKTWLEVALNGPWSRSRQPGIPVTVQEIVEQGVACAKAGAAIIHLHAYDEQTGRQKDDADLYARLIGEIRSKVDAIVYPTIPCAGLGGGPGLQSGQDPYAHVEELARRGLMEWGVVDPGSTNFADYDDLREDKVGFVYINPEEHTRHGLDLARRRGEEVRTAHNLRDADPRIIDDHGQVTGDADVLAGQHHVAASSLLLTCGAEQ